MSRKKKQRSALHRNRPVLANKAKLGVSKVVSFDEWKSQLPQWIKEARDFVAQGDLEKAAELFTEELVQNHINAASMPQKGFIMLASARLLKRMMQIKRAEKLYKQLLELIPNNVDVLNEMSAILQDHGKINEAVKCLTKAMEIDPHDPTIWTNLGFNLICIGQRQKGIGLLKDAVEKMPNDNLIWSTLLLSMHYLQDIDRAEIFNMTRQWANINAPAGPEKKHYDNKLDPNRKLRIGYISPDYREHSGLYSVEPLLDGHNRDVVELYGYGNGAIVDNITDRFTGKFDHYRNIYALDDKAKADLIEKDRIDILVDLTGHMGGSGIYAMAHKPAPIQVTWLGYPGTTGMTQMDYRLTDEIVDPPGSEKFHSEKLVYLPAGFLVYEPCGVSPAVSHSPFIENGYITFGCFNNIAKLNPFLIELWSKVLKATPDSKLLLKFKSGQEDEVKEMYIKQFEKFGIASDRIIISGWLPSPKHLELYNQVDIALDTFPYNGTVTTCQALLMGVPVISLVGQHHMSRVGLSILTRLGLEFFAASTPDEYVSKAAALAAKPDSLEKIRVDMRTRLATSSLSNNAGFAINVEKAYRTMWHQYCKSQGVEIADCKPQFNKEQKIKDVNTNPSDITEKDTVSEMPENKKKSKRGIMYVIWGDREKDENLLQRSIKSVSKHHPELPIHIERFKTGSKITKTRMLDMTPFEETLYLDNDTVVMGRLDFGFDKAKKIGLACCINENPWARRYGDERLTGDMVEYNCGVLFFTKKAKPVFDTWTEIFHTVDCSLLHYQNNQLCKMTTANQASFVLAIEQSQFLPFVLPINWNLRPQFYRTFFGPVKIWHGNHEVPELLLKWNKQQSDENAVIRFIQMDVTTGSSARPDKQELAVSTGGVK